MSSAVQSTRAGGVRALAGNWRLLLPGGLGIGAAASDRDSAVRMWRALIRRQHVCRRWACDSVPAASVSSDLSSVPLPHRKLLRSPSRGLPGPSRQRRQSLPTTACRSPAWTSCQPSTWWSKTRREKTGGQQAQDRNPRSRPSLTEPLPRLFSGPRALRSKGSEAVSKQRWDLHQGEGPNTVVSL